MSNFSINPKYASNPKREPLTNSRFANISNKITKYREAKLEKEKQKDKDSAQKLKDIQKQQAAMAQQQSPAEKMRENFNSFAGMNFAGANAVASHPTVKAPTPINALTQESFENSVNKKLASIEKLSAENQGVVTSIKPLYDIAEDKTINKDIRNSAQRLILSDKKLGVSGWPSFGLIYGPMAMKMLGLGRNDDTKNLTGRVVNHREIPYERLGDLYYRRGGTRMVGQITGRDY